VDSKSSRLLYRKYYVGATQAFNVHSHVRAQSTSEAERVGKYMIRLLLSFWSLSPESHLIFLIKDK